MNATAVQNIAKKCKDGREFYDRLKPEKVEVEAREWFEKNYGHIDFVIDACQACVDDFRF